MRQVKAPAASLGDSSPEPELTSGSSGHHRGLSRHHGYPGATRVAPSGGLGSGPPLLGQYEKARSARAVMVSAGLAPGLAGMAEPSTTCSPGYE